MKRSMVVLVCGLLLATGLLAALWIYSSSRLKQISAQGENTKEYSRHYALITDDYSDQWESIYTSARDRAEEENVYLEWVGEGNPANYAVEDLFRIAAASRVDGILLHHSGSESMKELIDDASREGIPVITVLKDESDSSRISYIGINNYQMGETYGEQILKLLRSGSNQILVLLNETENDTYTNIMYSQMAQKVENERPQDRQAVFSTFDVNTSTSFDAEEDIRDIFVHRDSLPDIMVCLDLISTECAYQALVDFNEVGNMDIVGYYASDTVLDGIRKGVISATLSLDAEEIGRLCIDALNEYCSLGHVSNYFNVGLEMITPEGL